MMDEYEIITGHRAPGIITGKPLELGGSKGRSDATARGGIYAVREAAKALNIDLRGKRAAIQGYGNAGSFAHKLAVEILGMKVVAVSDSKGGIYDPDGLNYEQVLDHKRRTGSVIGFPDTRLISNEELLELDVTVLFPAALENVITEDNARNLSATIVAELANGPTTPEADEILFQRGVYVIPDILCNAGGVTVSYFEQVQDAYNYYWKEEEVHRQLDEKMKQAFRDVHKVAVERGIHNRLAADVIAVERVFKAMQLRGWL
jgi:glutamate dehydrogenase (NAD(P)+)